jgi:hypothetical protein
VGDSLPVVRTGGVATVPGPGGAAIGVLTATGERVGTGEFGLQDAPVNSSKAPARAAVCRRRFVNRRFIACGYIRSPDREKPLAKGNVPRLL